MNKEELTLKQSAIAFVAIVALFLLASHLTYVEFLNY